MNKEENQCLMNKELEVLKQNLKAKLKKQDKITKII
jgi:hypothetical protein